MPFLNNEYKKAKFIVDGKTICASGINILNLFATKTKQCINQSTFKKGQEIEAVINLLKLGNFNPNSWISLDALHAHKNFYHS